MRDPEISCRVEMSELDEIRAKYAKGQFEFIAKDLEAFIQECRSDIRKFQREFSKRTPIDDALAIKLFILKRRSINPRREITDQLREIEREKWIHGVKAGAAPDPERVATQWAKLHSPGWRAHRVMTIIYVFEQNKDRLVRLLDA